MEPSGTSSVYQLYNVMKGIDPSFCTPHDPNVQTLERFFVQQLAVWKLAQRNFEALRCVRTRDFTFDGFRIAVQFNPERVRSSAARVDAAAIAARPCFLCEKNRPAEQQVLPYGDRYQILVNPYPIFPYHFTIPALSHEPQSLRSRYADLLALSRSFEGYVVFYNGPQCGASAPDHAHFQMIKEGYLPAEHEVSHFATPLREASGLRISAVRQWLRNSFLLEAETPEQALQAFEQIYRLLPVAQEQSEPMLNLLCKYEEGRWWSLLIPRAKHRPSCFFTEGEARRLISPASVDLGGVLITPSEADFNRLTDSEVIEMLREVCVSDAIFDTWIAKIISQ